MPHFLRFVQFLSCPLGVPLGAVLNTEGDLRALLTIWTGPMFLAVTSLFVATAAWSQDRRLPKVRS